MNSIIPILRNRGLIHQVSNELFSNPTGVYCGFDPTARSLHVGNLLSIIGLLHFQINNIQPFALIGGATGGIGDPSGKSIERVALSSTIINENVESIHKQLVYINQNAIHYLSKRKITPKMELKIVNNMDWLKQLSFLDFLRNVGKTVRVSSMLSRDSVKNRLSSVEGISFTEFSYQLLQAYDFHYLFSNHDCNVQMGGSDQWGNIIAGIDLIKKKQIEFNQKESGLNVERETVYGLTFPLITHSNGEKFDPSMTSPFELYQFFRRVSDKVVESYLNYFTFLSISEIKEIMKSHQHNPEPQTPQIILAKHVTELVHGEKASHSSYVKSSFLFDPNHNLSKETIESVFQNEEAFIKLEPSDIINKSLVDIIPILGLDSKNQIRKMISGGGLYLNKIKVESIERVFMESDFINGFALINIGKSKHKIISLKN